MGAAVAAVMAAKERQIVRAFTDAGATSPATAQTLDALGIDEGMVLRRLRKRAVIREVTRGAFYIDLEVLEAVHRMRRRLVAVMLLIVALLAAVVAITLRSARNNA